MAICQVCGKSNSDDARYCFSCGATLVRVPPVKVEVKSPLTGQPVATPQAPPIYSPRQIQTPGSCYYHHDLPSSYVCSRCGRSICAGCNKAYGVLSFCPECYWGLAPKFSAAQQQYPVFYPQPEQSRTPFF